MWWQCIFLQFREESHAEITWLRIWLYSTYFLAYSFLLSCCTLIFLSSWSPSFFFPFPFLSFYIFPSSSSPSRSLPTAGHTLWGGRQPWGVAARHCLSFSPCWALCQSLWRPQVYWPQQSAAYQVCLFICAPLLVVFFLFFDSGCFFVSSSIYLSD